MQTETDGWTHRQTDMINHQKPAYERFIQRVYCSIKDVSLGGRMVNNATFFSKILLSISAIFADTIPYFKIMQFLSSFLLLGLCND